MLIDRDQGPRQFYSICIVSEEEKKMCGRKIQYLYIFVGTMKNSIGKHGQECGTDTASWTHDPSLEQWLSDFLFSHDRLRSVALKKKNTHLHSHLHRHRLPHLPL